MAELITGYTKLLGLIGDPVGHSASPQMYNYASQLLDEDYAYLAFKVGEEGAGKALEAMRTLGIVGFNVTMPCKRAVLPFLDQITPEAKLMNAVNAIVNKDGVLTGHNTDGYGMMQNIIQGGTPIFGARLVLFGTGGASTAMLVQAVAEGAAQVTVVGRRPDSTPEITQLIQQLGDTYPSSRVSYLSSTQQELVREQVAASQILINGTPLGMSPQLDRTPLDTQWILPTHTVADAVYNPLETKLLREAAAAGAKVENGLGMLLWQGARAYQLFTGREMPVAQVRQMLLASRKG